MTKRCRHERNSWIIAGGYQEWCFVCGALRRLKPIQDGSFPVMTWEPASRWIRPTGDKNKNPLIAELRDRTR